MLRYALALPNPASHLFHVTMACDTNGASDVEVEFPAWSPGRYFIYDFARNVQEFGAVDDAGKELSAVKVTKGRWRIACRGADHIVVAYKMYGETLSGTFSQLDDRHAAINGPSLFPWFVGRENEEISLEISHPAEWRVYTSLPRRRRGGKAIWSAANYDILIDSPIEIGRPLIRHFEDRGVRYHIVVDLAGSEGTSRSGAIRTRVAQFVSDVQKTVRAYTATFGPPDLTDYHFLVNIDPFAPGGDGMEHLASTRLVLNGYITDQESYDDLIGVASHEFFHIWNVKRMRPAELGPFNYAAETHTTLLWIAEGFTQYYGHLMLRRAGVWDDKQLYKALASEINNVDRAPGRFHRNLRESSFDTWHSVGRRSLAGAVSNYRNTYVNYYHKGAVAALLLDMELRRLTANKRSLDDLMRELYRETYATRGVGKYFLRGEGYDETDVLQACQVVAGRRAGTYLKRLIESRDELDYNRGLAHVGLRVARGTGAKPGGNDRPPFYLGISTASSNDHGTSELIPVDNVLPDSPAEKGGMSANDLIIALDGERVTMKCWQKVLATKEAGDRIQVTFFRGGRLMTAVIVGTAQDVRPYRVEGVEKPTVAQRRARLLWSGGRGGAAIARKSRQDVG